MHEISIDHQIIKCEKVLSLCSHASKNAERSIQFCPTRHDSDARLSVCEHIRRVGRQHSGLPTCAGNRPCSYVLQGSCAKAKAEVELNGGNKFDPFANLRCSCCSLCPCWQGRLGTLRLPWSFSVGRRRSCCPEPTRHTACRLRGQSISSMPHSKPQQSHSASRRLAIDRPAYTGAS